MDKEEIKKEFDKFFNESPFAKYGEEYRVAMYGAYIAGWNMIAERLVRMMNADDRP
jgi:hypothetical protein